MNYYPFHLGDYASHTGHLDPMEDLAYRRLIDAYYLREGQLPASIVEVARLVRLRDHQEVLQAVLDEFFELTDEGWFHGRCEKEVARMQDKQAKARQSAQASVNARKANAERTLNGCSTDVKLPTPTPTPTPTPVTKGKSATSVAFVLPEWIDKSLWDAWHSTPKRKKATNEQKALAVEKLTKWRDAGIDWRDALEKSAIGGWQGLFPPDKNKGDKVQSLTFAERDEMAKRRKWEEMTGRKWPENYEWEIVDTTPNILELGK